jgi:hypothetical protein
MMSPLRRFFAWLPTPAAKGVIFAILALLFGARLLLERAPPSSVWRDALDAALAALLWSAIVLAIASLLVGRIQQRRGDRSR